MTSSHRGAADAPDGDGVDTTPKSASPSPARRSEVQPNAGSPRVVTSHSLLAGAPELAILHNETTYFLRQTRLGKLILTK